MKETAKALASHRQATVLQVKDANHLFQSLQEKVQALADMAVSSHPLSPKMAAATVKRYVVEPSAKIRLRDLVHEETEKLFSKINSPSFSCQRQLSDEERMKRVNRYDTLCETLLSIFVTGCYWGDEDSTKLWTDSLQRIANLSERSGVTGLLRLCRSPALVLMYGAGLAAIANDKFSTLAAIFTQPKVRNNNEDQPICSVVYPMEVVDKELALLLLGQDRRFSPENAYFEAKLREPLREYLPRDEDYKSAFDRFEYLLGLVHASERKEWYYDSSENKLWGPVGCFGWRRNRGIAVWIKMDDEIKAQGSNWPLLKAGLFNGSLEQLKTAKTKFDNHISGCGFY